MKIIPLPIIAGILVLLSTGVIKGNPLEGPPIPNPHIYMAYERLEVTVSMTHAEFQGTFQFAGTNWSDDNRKGNFDYLLLPIWFPQQDFTCREVAAFWNTFGTNLYGHIRSPKDQAVFDEAIGLEAFFGNERKPKITFFREIYQSDYPPFQRALFIFLGPEEKIFHEMLEPGHACLLFRFNDEGRHIEKGDMLKVSYRQPLFQADDGTRRFFYLPIFAGSPPKLLTNGPSPGYWWTPYSSGPPPNLSTGDTNRYAIILTAAPGCSLSITNGAQHFELAPGRSLTLSPQHLQAIRATVTPAKPQ